MTSRCWITGHGRHAVGAFSLALAQLGCAIDDRSIQVLENRTLPDAGVPARQCLPDEVSCVSTTQRRVCSSDGRWLPVEQCPNACVGGATVQP